MLEWLSHLLVLLRELKRRKVVNVVILYAIGWAAGLQIVDAAVSAYNLPAVTATIVGKLLLFGFFAAIILSWLFDWTEAGIIRAQPWPALTDSQRIVLYRGVIALLAVSISMFMAFLIWQARSGAVQEADRAAGGPVLVLSPIRSTSPDAAGTANALEAFIHHALTTSGGHVFRTRDAMAMDPFGTAAADSLAAPLEADFHVSGDVTLAGGSCLLILQLDDRSGLTVRTWQYAIEEDPSIEALNRVARQASDSVLSFIYGSLSERGWSRGSSGDGAAQLSRCPTRDMALG